MQNPFDLADLLTRTVACGASDLHLCTDSPPMVRVHGALTPLEDRATTVQFCRELILGILSEEQKARLESEWELDFALKVEGLGRFRGNAHYSRGSLEAAFRHIPERIPELHELGHRPAVFQFCEQRRGLILVTGITGSGKSTTMASMIQHISRSLAGVIVTIEDPVEFVFQNARSVIKQREVGSDTHSFSEGLRRVLRQDPDVILVGEMRDPETISSAITAAETGHLVVATIHTIDAPKAIDRIVDAFPAAQQPQVIAQLANSLQGIISQRLLPRCDVPGRVLATEILVANTGVRACIRERRWEQLVGLLEIGTKDGMHTIDDDLQQLLQTGMISHEEALANAREREAIEALAPQPTPQKRGLFR